MAQIHAFPSATDRHALTADVGAFARAQHGQAVERAQRTQAADDTRAATAWTFRTPSPGRDPGLTSGESARLDRLMGTDR
jgi:hypothetical protein